MQNPWTELPKNSPFVLDIDKAAIDNHNQEVGYDFQIVPDMYPEPFYGHHDADIVILNLNPGFGGEEDLKHHRKNHYFIELLKNNLWQNELEYPFIFLDPKISDAPGYRWWNARLKTLVEKTGRSKLAKSLLCLEFFPYHSKKFNFKKLINSQHFNFQLVKKAIKREALIICFRGFKKWSSAVPELLQYKKLFPLNSSQSVYLTLGNCPLGYNAVLNVLGVPAINLHEQMTNSRLREKIMNVIKLKIAELGMDEYLTTPRTSTRKLRFDAHIKLTPIGKIKFKTNAENPSQQFIHPDLKRLKISRDFCPVNISNNIDLYENFALEKLQEFIYEIGLK